MSGGQAGPQVLLPAQQSISPPPSHLFTESTPESDPSVAGVIVHDQPAPQHGQDASGLTKASSDRAPNGAAVIDPASVLESGRLYHSYHDGQYFLPNDAAEQDRLDIQHHVFTLILDGHLYLAPMTKVPRHVLDIGTGTGIWAVNFAKRFPTSRVIGTDLSLIQPDPQALNCSFQRGDAESEWVFRTAEEPSGIKFDFIHLRMVFTCFSDTRSVIKQAFDNMNPGGWVEFQDLLTDPKECNFQDPAIRRYVDGMARGAAAAGRDLFQTKRYPQWLEEAGFVDVQVRRLVVPSNPWPKDKRFKEIGLWQLKNLLAGLDGISARILRAAGLSEDEANALVSQVKENLRNCSNHAYGMVYVVYGRKPFNGEAKPPSAPIA